MILDDLAAYVAAQSTALSIGSAGNLGKGIMLDETTSIPDTFVSLYETGGFSPVRTFSTGGSARDHRRPNIQVLSRSTSYQTARNNAETVFGILDGYSGAPTTSASTYLRIDAIQDPFSIGRDRNGRFLISCNYSVWMR